MQGKSNGKDEQMKKILFILLSGFCADIQLFRLSFNIISS